MDEKTISEVAKVLGKKGGRKTAEKGPDYYRQIQKLGVLARKMKKMASGK